MDMFDLPDAKRYVQPSASSVHEDRIPSHPLNLIQTYSVRRADLRSPTASPTSSEPDPELSALLRARLESLYGSTTAGLDVPEPTSTSDSVADPSSNAARGAAAEQQAAGFEFRLFASATAPTAQKDDDDAGSQVNSVRTRDVSSTRRQRIILDDEGAHELDGPGGFVVPRRSASYYFVDSNRASRQRPNYQEMAVSGEQVKSWLGVRYRAWEVPWRVSVVRTTTAPDRVKAQAVGNDVLVIGSKLAGQDQAARKKQCKLGKKSRIKLRIRSRVAQAQGEKARLEREVKEEAEREKKSKKNKEKQTKKRAKEKARKLEERMISNIDTADSEKPTK